MPLQLNAVLPRDELSDFKAALDAHAIVAITDPRGRITYVNDKFCEISQYAREELIGRDHRMINSGLHPKAFFQDLWHTIGRGEVWQGRIKNRAKDGSFYWVDTTIVPFLDAAGKPRQYIAIRADVTQRVLAEEARNRLAAIVDSSDDAIISKTLTGVITSWNLGAQKVFGYSAAEAIGKPLSMLIPPDRLDEEMMILGCIAAGKSIDHFETVRLRKDGQRIHVSVTVSPLRDEAGRIIGASKVARDITREKEAQDQVQHLYAELEQRVKERTAQLEEANCELESFSYSVSHDLRAPLRAMDGFSQALLEDCAGALPDQGKRYLDNIRRAAQRMGDLIDDLLALSRLSRQEMRRVPVMSRSLVQTVLAELGQPWPDRKVDVCLGDLPDCHGDPALLRQVWANLISNALKYTGRCEHALIEIGGHREDGAVEFVVKDNGAGFDMRYAGKLFGVFQRMHRMEDYPGTGVGLAIVQRIVHRHGGRVWADAAVGRGATFHFTLVERI